jgi:cytochrome P450
MPYTEAVIMEVLRKSSLVPLGVLHRALADKEFHGYMIPKGTLLLANLYSVHHNPKYWGDPENFRPERFLSEDGTKACKPNAFVPFQIGKRQCLGEPFAKDSLFLFISSIYHHFTTIPDPENPKLDFEPKLGFLQAPKPFRVVFKDRLQ